MTNKIRLTFIIFISIFMVDQAIKYGFAHFSWDVQGPIISLQLTYNYGVAFSMFTFLAQYLKYIQLFIVLLGTIYLYKNQQLFKNYYLPIALLYAGGLSNILDRFTYGGVVDYVYWHYLFEFAIFNLADVTIDLAVVIIIFMQLKLSKTTPKKA